jgi:hypothetical protein
VRATSVGTQKGWRGETDSRPRTDYAGTFGGQTCGSLEAPICVLLCHFLTRALLADVLKQSPPHHFTDLGFVIRNEVLGDTTDDFRNPVLPLLIPLRHLDLAARQADHRGGFGRAGHSNCEVLDEGMETVGHAAVAVDKVQHLVEEQQYRAIGCGEEPGLVILVVNWVKASADKKVRWAPSASGGGIRLGEDMWRKSGSRMDCPVRPGNDDLMALIRWSSTDQITPPFLPPRPPAKTSYAAPQARARGCARSSAGLRRRCRSPAPRGRAL